MLHCGFTAMGCPAPEDTHPLHGELPNIPYDTAMLTVEDDSMTLSGSCRYRVGFTADYTFAPSVTLAADATVFDLEIAATNHRRAPMEYMYLCHVNFRPEDGGELVYSAPYDPAHVKVHYKFEGITDPDAYRRLRAYMDAIAADPCVHHVFDQTRECYDPEICMTVFYSPDAQGFAHTMQVLPDGWVYYIAHEVAPLPYVVRWLSRTGDEEACGMALPATAEHNGFIKARADGQVRTLGSGETYRAKMRVGLLAPEEATAMRRQLGK